jgi:hypothetical protein
MMTLRTHAGCRITSSKLPQRRASARILTDRCPLNGWATQGQNESYATRQLMLGNSPSTGVWKKS